MGPFSVAIPQDLTRLPVTGIDTAVDEVIGEGLRLAFSDGMYGSLPSSRGLQHYAAGDMTVDGRRGIWVSYTRSGEVSDGLPYAWAGHISTPPPLGGRRGEPVGLTNYLSCATRLICELGHQAAATVQFD